MNCKMDLVGKEAAVDQHPDWEGLLAGQLDVLGAQGCEVLPPGRHCTEVRVGEFPQLMDLSFLLKL